MSMEGCEHLQDRAEVTHQGANHLQHFSEEKSAFSTAMSSSQTVAIFPVTSTAQDRSHGLCKSTKIIGTPHSGQRTTDSTRSHSQCPGGKNVRPPSPNLHRRMPSPAPFRKTTEELELERIAQMRDERRKVLERSRQSFRNLQNSCNMAAAHIPKRTGTMTVTIPVEFNFATEQRSITRRINTEDGLSKPHSQPLKAVHAVPMKNFSSKSAGGRASESLCWNAKENLPSPGCRKAKKPHETSSIAGKCRRPAADLCGVQKSAQETTRKAEGQSQKSRPVLAPKVVPTN